MFESLCDDLTSGSVSMTPPGMNEYSMEMPARLERRSAGPELSRGAGTSIPAVENSRLVVN
jgi:hypothetical protein